MIVSDNASTDSTEEICRHYAAADRRVRYIRQPQNIGAAPNHNYLFGQARGELFKWASDDDLYGQDLLQSCINALDSHPHVVLSHARQAIIDSAGQITQVVDYPLATDSPSAPERFRSMLFAVGGDDFYGVIRSDVLRRVHPHDSYHHADRTLVAEIALQGPFYQSSKLLYFRRDHPDRAERSSPSIRAGAPTWTRVAWIGCGIRPSACTASTSGGSCRRCGVRRCRRPIGTCATAT